MSVDERLREGLQALPQQRAEASEEVLARVVAGGRRRRAIARGWQAASVAAALVLIGATTFSLTRGPSIDFAGPVPAGSERAALPDCGGLDLRGAHSPRLSADGRVLAFIDQPRIDPAAPDPGLAVVVCEAGLDPVRKELRRSSEWHHMQAMKAFNAGNERNPPEHAGGETLSLSTNGRFVVFSSINNDLVPDDQNGRMDVFLFDRVSGEIELVSRDAQGRPAHGGSLFGTVSDDGRWVAVVSEARLAPGQRLRGANVYLRDREEGSVRLVTRVPDRGGLDEQHAFSMHADRAWSLSMAANGTLVFTATSGVSNGADGVFVYEPARGGLPTFVRRGLPAKISSDGRWLLQPERVVTPEHDPPPRLRLIDLRTGKTELIPFGPSDQDLYVTIVDAAISAGGRFIGAALRIQNRLEGDPETGYGGVVHADDHQLSGPVLIHDRDTGLSTEVRGNLIASELGLSADASLLVAHASESIFYRLRGLNGIVLFEPAAERVVNVTWNPPWYEGRAVPITILVGLLLSILSLYEVWRLFQSPLPQSESRQFAVLVLVLVGGLGWATVGGRTAGWPLAFIGAPAVVAFLLGSHTWSPRAPFARARPGRL